MDDLVKHSNCGYLTFHNKLEGKLDLAKLKKAKMDKEDDPFYKGGIGKFSN